MTDGPPRERFWATTLVSLGGPLIWAIHFGAFYVVQHAVCAIGQGQNWLLLFGAAVTLAALLPLGVLALWPASVFNAVRAETAARDFLHATTRILAALSFVAVVWTSSAMLFLPICPAPR